jgi:hypothetical protein
VFSFKLQSVYALSPWKKKAILAIGYSLEGLPDASLYVNCSRLVSHPDSSVVKPSVDTILSYTGCTVPVVCNIYNVRSAHLKVCRCSQVITAQHISAHLQVCRCSQVITAQHISHAEIFSSNNLKNYFPRALNSPHEILISVTFIPCHWIRCRTVLWLAFLFVAYFFITQLRFNGISGYLAYSECIL